MKAENLAPKEFGFNDHDEIRLWTQTLSADFRFNEDQSTCLYTDGDEGFAAISISEVFDEQGITVSLIDCAYCDFDFKDLIKIHRILKINWLL